jgi:hypothetical protein
MVVEKAERRITVDREWAEGVPWKGRKTEGGGMLVVKRKGVDLRAPKRGRFSFADSAFPTCISTKRRTT